MATPIEHEGKMSRLCREALEKGWILTQPDTQRYLFVDGLGTDYNVTLSIGEGTTWIATLEFDVMVYLIDFERLPDPKAAAGFVALLRKEG